MPRQWRCSNGHSWTGEIGALTYCPECNSHDVFEVRAPGAKSEPPPGTGSSESVYARSRRHRPKKRFDPPPQKPPTENGQTLIQSPTGNPADQTTIQAPPPDPTSRTTGQPPAAKDLSTKELIVPTDPVAPSEGISTSEYPALRPAEQSTMVVAPAPAKPSAATETLVCDESCLPPPAGDHPGYVPSSTSDSTLDAPGRPKLESDQTIEELPNGPADGATMFELVSPDVGKANDPPTGFVPSDSGNRREWRQSFESSETKIRPGAAAAPEKSAGGNVIPQVAGYEILGVLGRGGMGVVYKARQRGLNRLVALKMILGGKHAGEGERGRFQTEALAVAKLQHANIVQVYEVGQRDGLPFFSLEYLDGGSLSQYADGKPLAPRFAAAVVELLARAMQYAHANGIVHRDLKPANILLKGHDDADTMVDSGLDHASHSRLLPVRLPFTPKITDFGLAKNLQSESGLTGTGAILGTPSFMSPEQAEGKTREIGPPTDIHALGAILYDALTGRPPFLGADPMATIVQVRTMEPVPPSRWQPGLPRDLETICLKCLEKSPARRYESAGELADDLRRFLEGEPIRARPASVFEKAWKWARRRPTSAALIALSVLTLLGAAIAGGTIAQLKEQQAEDERQRAVVEKSLRDKAELQRDRAERESARAHANFEAARDAMDEFLTRVGDQRLRGEPRSERLQLQLLESALGFYDRFLLTPDGADPTVRREAGWAYQRAGRIREMQGRRQDAIEAYREADRLFAALTQQEPNEPLNRKGRADSLRQLASAYEADHQREQADAAYLEASKLLERLVTDAPDQPNFRVELASLQNSRAVHLAQRGQIADAIAMFRAALAGLQTTNAGPSKELRLEAARTEINLAGVLLTTHRQDEGRAALESGIASLRQLAADAKDPVYARELGRALDILGYANGLVKQSGPAISAYREAGAVFARLAADHPRSPDYAFLAARAHDNVANTLESGGSLRTGAADREKARTIYRRLVTNYPLNDEYRQHFALSLEIQGAYFEEFGQLQDAIAAVGEAVAMLERLAAENPNNPVILQQYGQRLVNYGILQARADAADKAEASQARAVAVLESALQRAPSFDTARQSLIKAYLNQAGLMHHAGRSADEDAAWTRAMTLQIKRAADFPDQPDLSADVAKTLSALADLRQDKPAQRLTALRSAYDRQKTALAMAPQRGDLSANLGVYGLAIVETLANANDFAGACEAAQRVATDMPPSWAGLIKAAQSLSQSAAAARSYEKLSDADRAKVARNCGDEALTLLRRAVAGGFRDATVLTGAPEFKELRDAPEFKNELEQLVRQMKQS